MAVSRYIDTPKLTLALNADLSARRSANITLGAAIYGLTAVNGTYWNGTLDMELNGALVILLMKLLKSCFT